MQSTRLRFDDYLAHLERESGRVADALAVADPSAPVPTCPEWTVGDLADHLTEVQSFWATVVRGGLRTDAEVEAIRQPAPPAQLIDKLGQLRAATFRLREALEQTPPSRPAWTWSSEQTAGFIYRRQALEAAVHRVDAEIAVAERTAVAADLATDGVDEGLRVMLGGCPEWGTQTPDDTRRLRIEATDTGATWVVSAARFTGTAPDGTVYDEPDLVVAERDSGQRCQALVRGRAEDLLCWVWSRPTSGELERSGDPQVLADLGGLIDRPIT